MRHNRSGTIWRGLSDSLGFLGTAVRLLGRHGPALFALAFAGIAAQWGVMELAKQAAKLHPLAGLLTVMIVPLIVLAVYVLMMRVVRGSLRFAKAAHASTGGHRNALDHLGSVLLPFLAVWAAQGFLDDLVEQYRFNVWFDVVGENLSHLADDVKPQAVTAAERLDVNLSGAVIVVIVVAFAARWGIGRLRNTADPHQPPRGPRWLGVLGAYFESVWLMLVFVPLAAIPATVLGWAGDRRIVAWFTSTKDDAVANLGSFSNPADGALSWIGDLFGNAQTVILAPVAWLTVGAIIYGHRLPDLSGESHDHEDRHATGGGFGKWAAAKARSQFTGRFGPLVGGLRLLARGSTRPLLLFCLLFVVVSPLLLGGNRLLGLEGWLWDLERLIAGPQDSNIWYFLSETLGPVNQAIQDVVLICLLTAAVDRLVLAQRVDRDLRAAPPAEPSMIGTATTAEQPAPQPTSPVPVLVGAYAAAPYAVALQPPPWPYRAEDDEPTRETPQQAFARPENT